MKKALAFMLALLLVMSLAACGKAETPALVDAAPAPNALQTDAPTGSGEAPAQSASGGRLVSKIGDKASFGSYDNKPIEWLCIAVDGDKALLITKDCIRLDIFSELQDGTQVVWADCSLRAWLNGEFLNSLSADEQAMLLETEHASNDNLGFADYPEEEVEWKTCTDKIFLLSAEEVQTYFPDDESRIANISLSDAEKKATASRYERILNYDESTGMDMIEELMQNGGAVEYWLRSNGRGYMVQTVDYDGRYSDYGSNQDASFKGVRPAMWVDLT